MIAEEKLVCLWPDGRRIGLHVRIGRPYVVDDLEARCPVAPDGLHGDLRDVSGGSSLQALVLALRLVRTLLRDVVDRGGKILLEGEGADDTGIDLDTYF